MGCVGGSNCSREREREFIFFKLKHKSELLTEIVETKNYKKLQTVSAFSLYRSRERPRGKLSLPVDETATPQTPRLVDR